MFQATIKNTEPETVAFIHMHGPYTQIPETFGTLYGWLESQGLTATGMPHTVYRTMPDEVSKTQADWELQAPVSDAPDVQENVSGLGVRHLASTEVAFVMHRGSYDSVGPTYEQLMHWIAANGLEITGPAEEVYFSDPAEVPPDEYLTEIRFPVRTAQH